MKTLIVNLVTNIFSTPDNDHSKDYEKIEKEYISAPFNPEVDIYIFLLFTEKDKTTDIKVRQLIKGVNTFIFEDVSKLEQFDFGDVDNLKELFTKLNRLQNYTNKILVTWDHGYGYLMFKNELTSRDLKFFETKGLINFSDAFKNLVNALKPNQPIVAGLSEKYHVNDWKAISSDDRNLTAALKEFKEFKDQFQNLILNATISKPQYLTEGYSNPIPHMTFSAKELTALTINELAKGIEESELKSFNLIVMSNCYMQNIDTAYALKDCTDYIISPQTTFPWESYDFSSLIPSKNQQIGDAFCKTILKKTQQSLEQKLVHFTNEVELEEIGFSCIKTKQSDPFFRELKKITTFLSDYRIKLSDDIYYAANQISDLSHIQGTKASGVNLDQIDLYFFLEFLNTRLSKYPEFAEPFNKLKQFFDDKNGNLFVLENRKGDLLYWDKNTPPPKNACKGISIFFPKNKADYENSDYAAAFMDDDVKNQTKFSKDFKWGLFIEDFFDQYK